MGDKCEWKDGKLIQCLNSTELIEFDEAGNPCIRIEDKGTYILDFCPCCGANIYKPEKKKYISNSECESKIMENDYRKIISILDDVLNPDSDKDDFAIACARIYGISKSQSFLYRLVTPHKLQEATP